VGNNTVIRTVPITPYIPVTAVGGSEVYQFSINTGLPNGLTFSTSTGQVSGTPTALSSTTTYSVTAIDSLSARSTSTFNLDVVAPPAITTTLEVSSGTFFRLVDTVGVSPVSAQGGYGSISFSINPSLPTGLSFNSSNGRISGIASQLSDQVHTILPLIV
jgi:hypothetical protein